MKQIFFALSPKKRAFLTGTLLLTGTGFLCRILGFFYRIFMSRTIGAEGLGIYNMVHPLLCPLRRFHPDRPVPIRCLQSKKGPCCLSHRPVYFFNPVPVIGAFHLQYLAFYRPLPPLRTSLRALPDDYGTLCSLCRSARLH